MSYVGYEQHLCKSGHLFAQDSEYFPGEVDAPNCPYCGEPSVFFNSVDNTNGEEWGLIPEEEWKGLQITEEVRKICNLGHEHVIAKATYRIPTKEMRLRMRHFYDPESGDFLRCSERK
jgi:hypothetical protein